jgi:hypothetical protein
MHGFGGRHLVIYDGVRDAGKMPVDVVDQRAGPSFLPGFSGRWVEQRPVFQAVAAAEAGQISWPCVEAAVDLVKVYEDILGHSHARGLPHDGRRLPHLGKALHPARYDEGQVAADAEIAGRPAQAQ